MGIIRDRMAIYGYNASQACGLCGMIKGFVVWSLRYGVWGMCTGGYGVCVWCMGGAVWGMGRVGGGIRDVYKCGIPIYVQAVWVYDHGLCPHMVIPAPVQDL